MKGALTAIAACLFLFPSCVQWNIGENIQSASRTYLACDYKHPVDGKVYRYARKGKESWYYARLPEVRCCVMPAIVRYDLYDWKGYAPCRIRPTGRVVLAEVIVDEDYRTHEPLQPLRIVGCRGEVKGIPARAVPLACMASQGESFSRHDVRPDPESAGPGPLREGAGTLISWSLDPVLSFVSTTAMWCCSLPMELLTSPFSQQQAPEAERKYTDSEPGSPVPRRAPSAS